MLDRPDAAELLKAMAKTLTDEVLPKTSGATRHSVRVVANLCLILEREFEAGPAASEETRQSLADLLSHDALGHDALGQDASLPELVAEFDHALRDADDEFATASREVLLKDVRRRLAIDRPGYDS